jgi:MFS family permease
VRLFLVTAAIVSFTNLGGIFAVLFNLYILRMGYGPGYIGLVNSIGSLVMAVTCLVVSPLERRWGMRKLMLVGLSMSVSASILTTLADTLPAGWQPGWLISINAFNAIGQALYLVNSQPFLAAACSDKDRGHVFSVQAAIFPLMGFTGSLVAGFLPGIFAGGLHITNASPVAFRYALLVSGIISSFSLITLFFTQNKPVERQEIEKHGTVPPPYGIISALALMVAFQVTGEWAARLFTNVYFDAGLGLPTSRIGLLMGVGQLLAVPAALATPLLVKRMGNKMTFVSSSIGIALCLLPLALMPVWIAAGLGYMGVIVMASIARPVIQTIQMQVVSPDWRSLMSSITTLTASVSMAAVSYLGGVIIPTLGYSPFFMGGAIITGSAVLFFWIYSRRSQSLGSI